MDNRKKSIEEFLKAIKNNSYQDDWYSSDNTFRGGILEARDLAGNALAQEVLKNTKVPIPSDGASLSRKEDFLNQMLEERYPEFDEPNLRLEDISKEKNAKGLYNIANKQIIVNPSSHQSIRELLATTLHEGGHKYDYTQLGHKIPSELMQMPGQIDEEKAITKSFELGDSGKKYGGLDMYNEAAENHHARIPKLRDAKSFEHGALKSMLKSGTFKALPIIGTAATAAAALSSPDASAAALDFAVPGGVESLGPSSDDAIIENPQANPEMRKQALMRMKNGK